MVLVRSLLYLLFLSLTTMVMAPLFYLLKWLIPFRTLARLGNLWGRLNLEALGLICHLRYRLHGFDKIPSANCIVLSKHSSAWETIALRGLLPPQTTWVIKRELLWIPFFGWGMAAFDPIALDRKAGRQSIKKLLHEGRKWLDAGRWVVIFPEGTRVAPGERIKYNLGGAMLAEKTGYPVLPIAHNAGVFWSRRSLLKFPGVIDLVVGDPIPTKGLRTAEINQRVEEWIEATVERLPRSRDA